MKWNEEEIALLKELCATHTWPQIAKILNRSQRSITDKAMKLKLKSPYRTTGDWTKREIATLINLYNQRKTNEEISKVLSRTQTAISIKLTQLGLTSKPSRKVRLEEKDNIKGKKFNLLTVDKLSENVTHWGQRLWICSCDCGGTKEVTKNHLEQNLVRSCGCLIGRVGINNPQWKGYEEIGSAFWGGYERGAKKRNLEFSVSIEEGWNLFINQKRTCALTGQELNFSPNSSISLHGTASLDRIDSSKGYTIDNVHWIHKDINRLKNNYTLEHFLEMCKMVNEYEHRNEKLLRL